MKTAVLGLLAAAALSGCGVETETSRTLLAEKNGEPVEFKKSGLTGLVKFKTLPTKVKKNAPFELRFYKTADGKAETGPFVDPGFPMNGKTVHFEMPDHGHGTKDPVVVTKTVRQEGTKDEEVVFEVDKLFLSMPGTWVLNIDLVKDGKLVETGLLKHVQK